MSDSLIRCHILLFKYLLKMYSNPLLAFIYHFHFLFIDVLNSMSNVFFRLSYQQLYIILISSSQSLEQLLCIFQSRLYPADLSFILNFRCLPSILLCLSFNMCIYLTLKLMADVPMVSCFFVSSLSDWFASPLPSETVPGPSPSKDQKPSRGGGVPRLSK